MSDLVAAERAVTPAIASVSTWNAAAKPQALINAIIGAHHLSYSLPPEVRRHIGFLQGGAARVGLAHGWGWSLTPQGDGVVSAWEELKAVRAEAIEMAMRAAGCAPYSWETNPKLFFQLGDAAPTVEQVIGEALATRDAELEKEAA